MKNIKGSNGERQIITLTLTRSQVKAIQDNEQHLFSGYGWGRRRGIYNIGDQLAKQIVKKAGKLFPEIAEEERQLKLAWEIKQELRLTLSEVRSKHEDEIREAQATYDQAHKAVMTLENQMEKELDDIIDTKFAESGITMFRSHGSGLALAKVKTAAK